jgi:hypothetical protein
MRTWTGLSQTRIAMQRIKFMNYQVIGVGYCPGFHLQQMIEMPLQVSLGLELQGLSHTLRGGKRMGISVCGGHLRGQVVVNSSQFLLAHLNYTLDKNGSVTSDIPSHS